MFFIKPAFQILGGLAYRGGQFLDLLDLLGRKLQPFAHRIIHRGRDREQFGGLPCIQADHVGAQLQARRVFRQVGSDA